MKEYIPIEKCKVGYLYKIEARNGNFGIYTIDVKRKDFQHTFELSRVKFGSNYIFSEFHWDDGEPFGTVKPLEELCKVPDEIVNGTEMEKLEYLNRYEKDYDSLNRV